MAKPPPEPEPLEPAILSLAKIALATARYDAVPVVRRLARASRSSNPGFSAALTRLLGASVQRAAPSASVAGATPVDQESHLSLVAVEFPVSLAIEPVFPDELHHALGQLVNEHLRAQELALSGLGPTRTALFTGPPGVGKTLAARWIADRLNLPLVSLDLSSVMSSLLGRTGANLRSAIDYAKQTPCVFLLDELDAVAKRRDDATEIGELKRLVTVLLQEIDRWPVGSLLLGATNHQELLDPAVWRRFEVVLQFPRPSRETVRSVSELLLQDTGDPGEAVEILIALYAGHSMSELESFVNRAKRLAALDAVGIEEATLRLARAHFGQLSKSERIARANDLTKLPGWSQRRINDLTGVSRDTIRRHTGGTSPHPTGSTPSKASRRAKT